MRKSCDLAIKVSSDKSRPSDQPSTMVTKVVAPFGEWASPISIATVTAKSRGISDPRVCPKTGTAYYLETRENGENSICKVTNDGTEDLLPKDYDTGNKAYEYGGSPYEVLNDGRVIFTNGSDNTVRILDPETRKVTYLTGKDPVLRYSDLSPNLANPWVLAFQEDHTHDTPAEITTHVVAINTETAKVKRIVTGADFYFTPKFNPKGTKIVWIQWNRPDMLFDKSELYMADFDAETCAVSNKKLVIGKGTGLAEPHWGQDGTLWYAAEATNYRSLFRIPPGSESVSAVKVKELEKCELGEHGLSQGSRTYTPITSSIVVATCWEDGVAKLMTIDADAGTCRQIPPEGGISSVRGRSLARLDDKRVIVVAQGQTTSRALRIIGVQDDKNNRVVRTSSDEELPKAVRSEPVALKIQSSKTLPKRTVHAFCWFPKNDAFIAPKGTKPPLIIDMHGGPTGAAGSGVDLGTQYFTSRGYAYMLVNYTGSTCYGREYRQSLFGNYGKVDAADAAEFAHYLREAGKVGKVGITGISSGGYGTLQCVTNHPDTFDAGFCVSGMSELESFDKLTHKLEMDYIRTLVLHEGTTEEEKRRIYKDRSALTHVDKVKTPLAFLHSREDTVVPIAQAEMMFAALNQEIDAKMIKVSGDGHSLRKPASQRIWITEEEAWWRTHLL